MSFLPAATHEALKAALRPTGRDLQEARSVALEQLGAHDSLHEDTLVAAALSRRGIAIADERGMVELGATGAVEQDDPVLVRHRISSAIREAIGVLVADGLVMQVTGTRYGEGSVDVPVHFQNTTGGVRFPDHSPQYGVSAAEARWRLVRPADHPTQQIGLLDLGEGLDDVLGLRGARVLAEALRCFNRGLHMAAVDLLAAASEAAWFRLASFVPDDEKLPPLVDAGSNAAEVIRRTADSLDRNGVLDRHARLDLRAQAAQFRQLRNYGLHPTGDERGEHESAFTEAGSALLFMGSRSYFLNLRSALEELQERGSGG